MAECLKLSSWSSRLVETKFGARRRNGFVLADFYIYRAALHFRAIQCFNGTVSAFLGCHLYKGIAFAHPGFFVPNNFNGDDITMKPNKHRDVKFRKVQRKATEKKFDHKFSTVMPQI